MRTTGTFKPHKWLNQDQLGLIDYSMKEHTDVFYDKLLKIQFNLVQYVRFETAQVNFMTQVVRQY